MSLIENNFDHNDRNEKVLKSQLRHWFRLDHLRPEQGIALLICFVLDDEDVKNVKNMVNRGNSNDAIIPDFGIPLLNGSKICSWLELEPDVECIQPDMAYSPKDRDYIYTLEHAQTIFVVPVLPHKRLLQIWNSGKGKHPEYTPLKYFVEWARMKGTIPEWMPVAVELELIEGENLVNDSKQPEIAPPYSTPWLKIQEAAIAQFFNPRRNPEARSEEVVAWIKEQAKHAGLLESNNLAERIFTIIKPSNHDPKKKRVKLQ